MKLKQGEVLVCGPENGCGIKVVVIEVCQEAECDIKCCGKDMVPLNKKVNPDVWKQGAQETDPGVWKKYAKSAKSKEE
ncbi:MAG: hypothetical protein NT045_05940 [Candidatus Aureabacteria bacterium]|nr:hypothetical protein [Candidatus Auribacterota bacterium]